MRCTAWIVSDELEKITSSWETLLVENKGGVCSSAIGVTWVQLCPRTGQAILTGGHSNAKAHYLAGLKAGNWVVCWYFWVSSLYMQIFTSPFFFIVLRIKPRHVCERTTLAKCIHLFAVHRHGSNLLVSLACEINPILCTRTCIL